MAANGHENAEQACEAEALFLGPATGYKKVVTFALSPLNLRHFITMNGGCSGPATFGGPGER